MGNIVQLVEQRTENPCVTGSSPVVATTLAWQNDYATDCKSVYPGLIPGVNSNMGVKCYGSTAVSKTASRGSTPCTSAT